MKQLLFSAVLIICVLDFSYAQQNPGSNQITGIVFFDKNKNGIRDPGENGINDVPVSNGDTIIVTNRKGRFTLDAEPGSSIFPIVPSGFQLNGSSIGNSNFRYIQENETWDSTKTILEFPLSKTSQNERFRIGVIGDLQVDDLQEINYANQTIIPELAGRNDLDFSLFLGDLINDNDELLPFVENMLKGIHSPTWTVFGNHDRVAPGKYQDKAFNAFLGASHYSFNYADVHFIVLNNVWSDGTRKYEGRITDRQLRFVANDLALVPANRLVVISQHIPMVYTKNKEQLLPLLENRQQVLILSGHTHQVSRHFLKKNVTELVAGASCGNWWVGEKNWQGIPSALMQCGSPRNYFVIDFDKNKFNLSFKGIGLDENLQMDIWVNGQDSIDQHIDGFSELKGNEVIANIYGGSDSTVVRMQVNSGEWITMQQVRMIAPNVNRLIAMNKMEVYPSAFSKRAAVRKSPSPHIWMAYLPQNHEKGVCRINIEAYDEYGFHVSGNRLVIF